MREDAAKQAKQQPAVAAAEKRTSAAEEVELADLNTLSLPIVPFRCLPLYAPFIPHTTHSLHLSHTLTASVSIHLLLLLFLSLYLADPLRR